MRAQVHSTCTNYLMASCSYELWLCMTLYKVSYSSLLSYISVYRDSKRPWENKLWFCHTKLFFNIKDLLWIRVTCVTCAVRSITWLGKLYYPYDLLTGLPTDTLSDQTLLFSTLRWVDYANRFHHPLIYYVSLTPTHCLSVLFAMRTVGAHLKGGLPCKALENNGSYAPQVCLGIVVLGHDDFRGLKAGSVSDDNYRMYFAVVERSNCQR